MRVLVTGAAGFIGTNLCEKLLEQGHSVIGVDDFSGKYPRSAYKENVRMLRHKNVAFYRMSVLDRKKVLALSGKKITHIVHLAAKAGVRDSMLKPSLYLETNVIGAMNVLDLARKARVKNTVLASTSSVYGDNKTPFVETMNIDSALSVYAASKAGMEALAHSYSSSHGMPITVLRFFTVYGPRGRRDMAVYKFADLIMRGKPLPVYGSGKQKRDFTYVDDIVEGVIAATKKTQRYAVYNLGCSEMVPLNRVISLLEKNLGKKAIIRHEKQRPEDVRATHADVSKANRELGFRPRTRLDEGIRRFCEWFFGEAP